MHVLTFPFWIDTHANPCTSRIIPFRSSSAVSCCSLRRVARLPDNAAFESGCAWGFEYYDRFVSRGGFGIERFRSAENGLVYCKGAKEPETVSQWLKLDSFVNHIVRD